MGKTGMRWNKENKKDKKEVKRDSQLKQIEAEFIRDQKIANGKPLTFEEMHGEYHPGLGCWM
jgi:hypothetical protein